MIARIALCISSANLDSVEKLERAFKAENLEHVHVTPDPDTETTMVVGYYCTNHSEAYPASEVERRIKSLCPGEVWL